MVVYLTLSILAKVMLLLLGQKPSAKSIVTMLRFLLPFFSDTLFTPYIVRVGVRSRNNMIEKGVIANSSEKQVAYYLPCTYKQDMMIVPLNSTQIIDNLSLDSWSTLKDGSRGAHKEYPLSLFYRFDDSSDDINHLFKHEENLTPFLLSEKYFNRLKDGEQVDVTIVFD